MSCSRGGSGGGPASSNFRSRVCAAAYREAISWLTEAACRRFTTSFFSWACFSSQRRFSSSKRANRSRRASWKVPKPPPCTHTSEPAGPGSTATIFCAARDSSSRSWEMKSTVLRVSRSRSSSHRLPGTSR